MKKTYSLFVLMALLVITCHFVQAQTVVFSDNFDRASFTTGSTGGTPATTYKFTLGGAFTINTTLVSGSNYRVDMTSPAGAQRALFFAPLSPYSAPFSRELSLNPGLVTWTFNMRTNTAVTTTSPLVGSVSGGIDLCGNAAGNIYNGAPTGYGVVFNSTATGGVDLVKFSGGLATNTILISQTTTMPKTNFYSVRVTFDPATNHWSLYVRNDGATAFADPSSGVTLQQGATITDNTYVNNVMVNFGAVYATNAGAGKIMSVDNFQVAVTVLPCSVPGLPTGLSYSNTATSASAVFTPPATAPTGYILVRSAGALSGVPATGQAVTVGTTVGSNGTIVGVGATSPVTSSVPLNPNTTYTMTLFPYNNAECIGGPVFNTAVSSNTITTCPNAPALTGAGIPTATAIPGVTWSAPAAGGGVFSSYTYLLNVYTDSGLTNPAPGYPSGGTTVTSPYTITGLSPGVTYWYTISAVDAACNSAPSASNTATTSIVPCGGVPVAGTATSSSALVTGSAPFTLGLNGASGASGISFQWQSSTCENSWTNIGSSGTFYSLSVTESAGTFYRCLVSCSNSGITAPSSTLYVPQIAAAYCTPASAGGCSAGDGVNSFTLSGVCGTSISDPGPLLCAAINTDHTNYAPVSMYAGSSYAASINSNDDGDDVYIWIDFNNNGLFESSEIVYSTNTGDVPGAPFFDLFNIPIPIGATTGLHRMRVTVDNTQTLVTGCDALSFGTSVDYMVQILPRLVLGSNSPVCVPNALALTVTPSISCGAVYTWSGPSGYTNTTVNSNSVNPPAVAGVYSVSVMVNGVSSCPLNSTASVVINTQPVITGITGMCVGSTATLTGAPSGGVWTSGTPGITTVGSGTGLITGISLGAATISYAAPVTGCVSTTVVNNTTTPAVFPVTGGGNFCIGFPSASVGLGGSGPGVSYQLRNGGTPTGGTLTGTGSLLNFGIQSATGTYTIVANPGTSCATTMSGSATLSNYPQPVVYTVSGGGGYCAGGNGVHIYLNGSNTNISYQLYNGGATSGAALAGTTGVLDFGLQTVIGTYIVVATNVITGCTDTMAGSATVAINLLPAPFAVTGTGSYCAGGTGVPVSLSNSATGINYQLFANGIPLGTPVTGIAAPLAFGLQTLAGTYTVIATDATSGCTSNMTGSAVVTVIPTPALNTVTGGGAVCAGGAGVHIGLNGSVSGVSYQLFNGFAPAGGAVAGTGSTLDFGAFTAAGNYTVVASVPSSACTSTMLGSVAVSVNPAPAPSNVTGGGPYCAGTGGVHVGLNGSVIGTNYFLYDNGVLTGGASGTGAPLDFGAQIAGGTYTISATLAATGCSGNMTGSVIVTVNSLPSAFNVTGGGGYCFGTSGSSILLSRSTAGVTYQLLNGVSPAGTAMSGTGSGLNFGPQVAPGAYTVLATTTATGCMNPMNGSAVVSVNPLPSGYAVTGGGSYCSGGAGTDVGLANSGIGINYQLSVAGSSVGPMLAGTGSALDFGLQTAGGNYTVMATNAGTSCTSTMPGNVTVSVNPLPNAYALTGGGSFCVFSSGSDIGLLNSDAGTNYQLYNGTTAVGPLAGGSGIAIDFGFQTITGAYTVIASNTLTGCVNTMRGSIAIGISPLPAAFTVTGGGGICPGSGVHIGLGNSAGGISYQLYNGGTAVGGLVSGTGTPLDFGSQTAAGTYSIVATNLATTCSSVMTGSATVSVNPLPIVHAVTGGGNYCAGATGVHIGLNGSNAGNTYQLYKGITASGPSVAGSGTSIDFGLQTIAGSYTVVATNGATGCTNTMSGGTVVTVNASPAVHTVTGGGSYCPGSAGIHIGLNGSDAGIDYQAYNGVAAAGSPVAGTGATLDFGSETTIGPYTVLATDATTGCTSVMTGATSVSVSDLPVVFNVSGTGSYCALGSGLHVLVSSSSTGVSYQLFNNGVPGAIVPGTGAPLDFGLQTEGNYTVTGTSSTTGCSSAMSGTAMIVANPLPAAFLVTGGGSYCTGGTGVHVSLGGSQTGVNYQLYAGSTIAGGAVAGTGSPSLDFGSQTTGGTYTVVAADAATGCTNTMVGAATVAINVLPSSYAVSGGGTFCGSGSGSDILLSGSSSGISYQLYNGTTATDVPLVGTGGALDFGLQSAIGTYTITGTNTFTTCKSVMGGSAAISSLPLPSTYNATGGGSYCIGGTGVDVSLSGSATGVSYQLYNGVAIGSPVIGTGAAIDFGLQTGAGSYSVIATDRLTSCSNNMTGNATVAVSSLPAIYTVTGSSTTGYCTGGAGVGIYLSNSETGVAYQLYRGATAIGAPVSGATGLVSFGNQPTAGIYTVAAVNAAGCRSAMGGSVSVLINPLPVTYTVTGGGGYCSGGSGVHIGLSGTSTGTSYQLYEAGVAIGPSVAGSGAGIDLGLQTLAGSYTVIATAGGTGCANNMTGSATVSIDAAPVAYTVMGGGSYCTGGAGVPIRLSGSVSGVNYQLRNGTGLAGSPMAGTGGIVDFGLQTLAGIYTVTATNGTTGCTGNMTGGVTVTALPLPAPQPLTGGGGYCAGSGGVAVGIAGSNVGITYRLYNGSTLTGSPVTGTGSATGFGLQTAAGTYTVVAENVTTSCVSDMPGSVTVAVNPLPEVYPVTGGGNYCAGSPGVHVGLGSSDAGVNYTLVNGITPAGVYAGTGGALDFGAETTTGIYIVSAVNATTGCSSAMSGSGVVGSIAVVTPLVNISTGAGGDTVCPGTQTFTAMGTNGGTAPVYAWLVNGVLRSTSSTYSYSPASGDNVSVTLTSSAACAIPAAADNSVVITVLERGLPVVSVSANPGIEVCQGTSVEFTATPTFGGASPVYQWMNGTTPVGGGRATFSYAPANGDEITCKMTSNYQCRITNTATSEPVGMTVDASVPPGVTISAFPGTSIAQGETATLTANVTNGGPAPTYQWWIDGVMQAGATSQTYTSSSFVNGDIAVCDIVSSGGCSGLPGSGTITISISNVGVKQVAAGTDDIKLLPNPNNGTFLIKGNIAPVAIGSNEEVTAEITNMLGQVVYKHNITAVNGALNEQVQLANIANGMYLLNLHTSDGTKVFHIIVEQ